MGTVEIACSIADVERIHKIITLDQAPYVHIFFLSGGPERQTVGENAIEGIVGYECRKSVGLTIAHHKKSRMGRKLCQHIADAIVETASNHRHHGSLVGIENFHEPGAIQRRPYEDIVDVIERLPHETFEAYTGNWCDGSPTIGDGAVPDSAIAVDGIPQGAIHIE